MPKTQKISSFTLYITRYSVSLSAVLFETRFITITPRDSCLYRLCLAANDKVEFDVKLWPGYEKRFSSHLHYFAVKKEVFISFSSQCKLTNKTEISLCVPSVHKQVMSQTTLEAQTVVKKGHIMKVDQQSFFRKAKEEEFVFVISFFSALTIF